MSWIRARMSRGGGACRRWGPTQPELLPTPSPTTLAGEAEMLMRQEGSRLEAVLSKALLKGGRAPMWGLWAGRGRPLRSTASPPALSQHTGPQASLISWSAREQRRQGQCLPCNCPITPELAEGQLAVPTLGLRQSCGLAALAPSLSPGTCPCTQTDFNPRCPRPLKSAG